MDYVFSGIKAGAMSEEMAKTLEVMRKYGVNHELSTVKLEAVTLVVNPDGSVAFSGKELQFPAWNVLREEGTLLTVAVELSTILGYPCHAYDAPVVAAYLGAPLD
jgi:hypothetical protein